MRYQRPSTWLHPSVRSCLQIAGTLACRFGPGLALTGAIAVAAVGLEAVETALIGRRVCEALVLAILLGMLVRNVCRLPAPGADVSPMHTASRVLTLWAMAGLGLGVELAVLRTVGLRVSLASTLSMGLLIVVSLLLIILLGLTG